MRLADVAHDRSNNFDVLRLVAATLVLVSHSYPLVGGEDPFGVTGDTLGALGVALFFSMSGFLILKSWTFDPELWSFVAKRALRIMPALWVAVFATTFLLGPVVTELGVGAYLTDPGAWTYALRASLMFPFGGELPGVFTDNPYGAAINGSLWTLPIELCAYAMTAVFGMLGLTRRAWALPAAYVAMLLVMLALPGSGPAVMARLFAFFLAGMLLYRHRGRVELRWPLAVVAAAIWCASFGTPLVGVIGALTLPYIVMVFAYRSSALLAWPTRLGDVSYGMYIYAFPVQQTTVLLLGNDARAWQVTSIALPVTWLLGLASWRLVERPLLRFKPRRAATPAAPVAATATAAEPELASAT